MRMCVCSFAFGAMVIMRPIGSGAQITEPRAHLAVSVESAALSPPFCFDCVLHIVPECQYHQLPACTPVSIGWTKCESGWNSPDCGDAWCITFGVECVWPPLAPDGSARAALLRTLSADAAAAVVGAHSVDTPMLRRPCDGTVMLRSVHPLAGLRQRQDTNRIVI
jgi:hypothetical protein